MMTAHTKMLCGSPEVQQTEITKWIIQIKRCKNHLFIIRAKDSWRLWFSSKKCFRFQVLLQWNVTCQCWITWI